MSLRCNTQLKNDFYGKKPNPRAPTLLTTHIYCGMPPGIKHVKMFKCEHLMFVETQYFMDSTKLHHSEIKHNNEGLSFL